MPALRIVFVTLGVFVLFGVLQDQITVRMSREYFTVAHDPREVPFEDTTLLALGWGIRGGAGGVYGGIALALVCTLGRKPPLGWRDVLSDLGWLFVAMSYTSTLGGCCAWYIATLGELSLGGEWAKVIPAEGHRGFITVACTHLATYATGVIGCVLVCVRAGRKRGQVDSATRGD